MATPSQHLATRTGSERSHTGCSDENCYNPQQERNQIQNRLLFVRRYMYVFNRMAVLPVLLLGVLLLSSCAGPRTAGRDEPEPPPARPPAPRTLSGFRIQILSTTERNAADEKVEEALTWWKNLPPQRRPAGLKNEAYLIDIHWRAPYYRVRMGNFTTRSEAEQALSMISGAYPDAFIVPDTVTVIR